MEPDYIVIRDPECPSISGKWYDLDHLRREAESIFPDRTTNAFDKSYSPTPFIEVRESDGAVAQVYMPVDP